MKIQELMEQNRIDQRMFDVEFVEDNSSPFIVLLISGLEVIFRVDLDIDADIYEDGFGWEQGDCTGTESWTQVDLNGFTIQYMELVSTPDELADGLADIFSMPVSTFDTKEKILDFLYKRFGGEGKLQQYMVNTVMSDTNNHEVIINYYKNVVCPTNY